MTHVNSSLTSNKMEIDTVVLMYKGEGVLNKHISISDSLKKIGPPLTVETHFSVDSVNSFSDDPSSIAMSDLETSPTNNASTKINKNPTVEPEEKSSTIVSAVSAVSAGNPSTDVRYISKERLDELEFIEQNVQSILKCSVDEYKFSQILKSIKKKTSKLNIH